MTHSFYCVSSRAGGSFTPGDSPLLFLGHVTAHGLVGSYTVYGCIVGRGRPVLRPPSTRDTNNHGDHGDHGNHGNHDNDDNDDNDDNHNRRNRHKRHDRHNNHNNHDNHDNLGSNSARDPFLLLCCSEWTCPAGGTLMEEPQSGEGDMSSRRWQQSRPRINTAVPHGDRGRPGQGGGSRVALHGHVPEHVPPPPPSSPSPRRLLPSNLRWTPGGRWRGTSRRAASTAAGGAAAGWNQAAVVSQLECQQHSAEQNVDIPVRGGVGHRGDRLARVLSDLAHLERVRGRTAMEVMRWFVDPARGLTLTSEEEYSLVRLMPDYRRRYTASPGRYINTGRRAEAGATDPGPDRGQRGRTCS